MFFENINIMNEVGFVLAMGQVTSLTRHIIGTTYAQLEIFPSLIYHHII